jgi:hypothetical protein
VQRPANDLTPFLSGIVCAAVAGMIMGAAFRPDLSDGDRPSGPQMMAGWTTRSTGPFDDGSTAVIADWTGAPPAYVVGTDALKAAAWTGPTAEPPLPDRDLEPLPTAEALQRIETSGEDPAPAQADTAALPAAADQPPPG